jgi:hypothetical protein
LKDAESDEVINERLRLRGGYPYPVLIEAERVMSTTKELKAFLVEQGRYRISKSAVVIHNKFDEFFVKLYLLLDEPDIPTKVFTNEVDAKQWLMVA